MGLLLANHICEALFKSGCTDGIIKSSFLGGKVLFHGNNQPKETL